MEVVMPDQNKTAGEDIHIDHSGIFTSKGLLQVIDALPLAIAVIDENNYVTLANTAALKFVRKRNSEVVGQIGGKAIGCAHYDDVPEGCSFGPYCSTCKLNKTVKYSMQSKIPQSKVEVTVVFKIYGERLLHISTLPMELGNDAVVLLAIEDITEARRHEQTRLQKNRLATVLEIAGTVCHELNQPLSYSDPALRLPSLPPNKNCQGICLITPKIQFTPSKCHRNHVFI